MLVCLTKVCILVMAKAKVRAIKVRRIYIELLNVSLLFSFTRNCNYEPLKTTSKVCVTRSQKIEVLGPVLPKH